MARRVRKALVGSIPAPACAGEIGIGETSKNHPLPSLAHAFRPNKTKAPGLPEASVAGWGWWEFWECGVGGTKICWASAHWAASSVDLAARAAICSDLR